MKKLAFLLVLIGLCVWPVGLRAQSAALMETYQQGGALFQAGRYDEALPFWKKALKLGQREFGPEHPSNRRAAGRRCRSTGGVCLDDGKTTELGRSEADIIFRGRIRLFRLPFLALRSSDW